MRKPLFILGIATITALPVNYAVADNQFIINGDAQDSYIEGTITGMTFDRPILKIANGSEIEINIDKLDVDDDYFEDFVPVGSDVRIIGHFDDDEFVAESMTLGR